MTSPARTGTARRGPLQADGWLPIYLLKEQLTFGALVWLAVSALTFVGTAVVAYWREIEISGWDQVANLAPWYALFIGAYVGWDVLPMYITHGQTRRGFMRQAIAFVAIFGAVLAAMVAVTYLAEIVLYDLTGWTQGIQEGRLFDEAHEVHLTFIQWALVITLWTAGGLFIAAAWYRDGAAGTLAILLGFAAAAVSGVTLETPGTGPVPVFFDSGVGDGLTQVVVAIGAHVALIAAILAAAWYVVRDVAVRPKSA